MHNFITLLYQVIQQVLILFHFSLFEEVLKSLLLPHPFKFHLTNLHFLLLMQALIDLLFLRSRKVITIRLLANVQILMHLFNLIYSHFHQVLTNSHILLPMQVHANHHFPLLIQVFTNLNFPLPAPQYQSLYLFVQTFVNLQFVNLLMQILKCHHFLLLILSLVNLLFLLLKQALLINHLFAIFLQILLHLFFILVSQVFSNHLFILFQMVFSNHFFSFFQQVFSNYLFYCFYLALMNLHQKFLVLILNHENMDSLIHLISLVCQQFHS